jgi:hypothetical protein
MVPEICVQDGSFPIPKLLIGKGDISQFFEEFRGFHAQFAAMASPLTKNDPYVLVSNDPEDAQLISWQSRHRRVCGGADGG